MSGYFTGSWSNGAFPFISRVASLWKWVSLTFVQLREARWISFSESLHSFKFCIVPVSALRLYIEVFFIYYHPIIGMLFRGLGVFHHNKKSDFYPFGSHLIPTYDAESLWNVLIYSFLHVDSHTVITAAYLSSTFDDWVKTMAVLLMPFLTKAQRDYSQDHQKFWDNVIISCRCRYSCIFFLSYAHPRLRFPSELGY